MECEGLETLCIKDQTLTNESMSSFIILRLLSFIFLFIFSSFQITMLYVAGTEKVVGWALSHHLMQNPEADPEARLVLSCER